MEKYIPVYSNISIRVHYILFVPPNTIDQHIQQVDDDILMMMIAVVVGIEDEPTSQRNPPDLS